MWRDNTSIVHDLHTDILQLEADVQIILLKFMGAGFGVTSRDFSDWTDAQKQQMAEFLEKLNALAIKLTTVIPIDAEKCNQTVFYEKRLIALSQLTEYPKIPSSNVATKQKDPDSNYTDIAAANGWKLQLDNNWLHYRILSPEKRRIAYGDKVAISNYLRAL